eukprot:TRINITY_DN1283_c0_g1_i1.p2 TRINITY_DN1283_c0_g1~~TRINITY_DN1283_c0_g1_i1.p2  ORF type:complete len:264 (-),score=55.30 TRINITY_DN1283_c0_g1_i1:991-1782(-)
MNVEIVIVRHGQKESTPGFYNPALTAAGRRQAQCLGTALQGTGITFNAILASPLTRTLQTAVLCTREMHSTTCKIGLENGVFEWLPYAHIDPLKFGDDEISSDPLIDKDYISLIPIERLKFKGETPLEVHLRARDCIELALRHFLPKDFSNPIHSGETFRLAFFCHAASAIGLLRALKGYTAERVAHCGYYRLRFDHHNHQWIELEHGGVQHWASHLPHESNGAWTFSDEPTLYTQNQMIEVQEKIEEKLDTWIPTPFTALKN